MYLDWCAKQIHKAKKINSPVLPVYGSNWKPHEFKWTEKSRNHLFEWFATQKRNIHVFYTILLHRYKNNVCGYCSWSGNLKIGIDVNPQFSSSKCYSKIKVQLIDWAKLTQSLFLCFKPWNLSVTLFLWDRVNRISCWFFIPLRKISDQNSVDYCHLHEV